MFHPSLLFLHGHFETTQDYDFTDDPVHTFLSRLPVLKAQDMRHSAHASRSWATWPNQVQTHVGETSTTTTIGSSSLSPDSLLAEVSLSVLPFEVWSNNRRCSGARAAQISNVDLVLPPGSTGMDPSQTSFFQLQSIGTKMVGPGASEIVLDLPPMDGASVFIFSLNFQEVGVLHLAYDNAFTLSFTSGVALVSPAIFNVVAPDSEEPIEDLLFPSGGSTSDVPSDTAFYSNEMSVTWTDGSKMITTTTEGMGQSNRVHVFTPGLSVSIDPPTIPVDESEVSVVVDEGAFLDVSRHCFALQQEHAGF